MINNKTLSKSSDLSPADSPSENNLKFEADNNVSTTHRHQNHVNRCDFVFGETIGKGSYACIKMCYNKSNDEEYAVKIMDKQFLRKEHATKYAMVEREVLSKINYPLILSLYYSFQDERYLYMVIELCRRGSLRDVIEEHFENSGEALSSEIIQFYTMEMILSLQKLHITYDVVHRDLKPENVLISSSGHIRISDFGTALVNQRAKSYRKINYSFCGTAQYVCPELLKDEPIGPACDLWALGCIIYQLYYGKSPFYAENEYLIFDKILQYDDNNKNNIFPSNNLPSESLQDLILCLLRVNPFKRLGSGGEEEEEEEDKDKEKGSNDDDKIIGEEELERSSGEKDNNKIKMKRNNNNNNSFKSLLTHPYFTEYNPSTIINTEPPFLPVESITKTISKDSIDNIDEDYSLEDNAVPVKLHLLDLTSSSSSSSNSTSSNAVDDSPSGKSPLIFSSSTDTSPLLKPSNISNNNISRSVKSSFNSNYSNNNKKKNVIHCHSLSVSSIPHVNSLPISTSNNSNTTATTTSTSNSFNNNNNNNNNSEYIKQSIRRRRRRRRTPQTAESDDDDIYYNNASGKSYDYSGGDDEEDEDENNNKENRKWKGFLNSDEMIVLNSAIWKKKTFRTVKRQLILTDFPRIIVIDPHKMIITKIITFEVPLIVTMKSLRAFDLKTRTRLYHYTDCSGHPEKWKNAIDAMNVQVFNNKIV